MKWFNVFAEWFIGWLYPNVPIDMPELPPKPPPEPAPAPVPEPIVVPTGPTLPDFALAIRDYEGSPGDRNYRNNNPGNCRYSSVGYLPMYEPVGRDHDNFAVFKDYATGWLYLQNMIKAKIHQHPDQTILKFMEGYAPYSDGNNPKKYATFIAKRLSTGTDFLMKNLV